MSSPAKISCPACNSSVTPNAIDESALSLDAKHMLARDERRTKFKSDEVAVDAARAKKYGKA